MATFSKAALIALTLALSACESAPSDEDLRAAIKQKMIEFGGKQAMDMMAKNLDQVKLIACKKADSQGYQCDVKGMFGSATSIRMVKSGGGWTVIE
jgi:hypothetical protein